MSFLDSLQQQTNKTHTENGAVTNKSTLDPVLDFFSQGAAMRGRVDEAAQMFERAYYSDPTLALRALFYTRDIRGGQGERAIFRACLRRVEEIDPGLAAKLVPFIPIYGRWDDLLVLKGLDKAAEVIGGQLAEDEQHMKDGGSVSLLAKWLPSENASSAKSSELARELMKHLGLKPSQYRRKLSALRGHIDLLERRMSAGEWEAVKYPSLPSQALRKHVKAFYRHDEERFKAYLEAAKTGGAKMNTSTLYTYEVFDAVKNGDIQAANAMWANLPDWTNGTNALVVADVSGSMSGRPMSVSVSLALYFAERNGGPFKDHFMTFSAAPQIVKVVGNDLASRLRNIENREWGYNTDVEAVFNALLKAARHSGAKGDDMPRVIYIISDMEFDQACANPNETIFDNAKAAFEAEGFKIPHIVFWNVNARNTQTPATKFDDRVTLISGLSQSTFKYAVEGKTPVELMHEVLNSDRYKAIAA